MGRAGFRSTQDTASQTYKSCRCTLTQLSPAGLPCEQTDILTASMHSHDSVPQIVHSNPQFVSYFRHATPEQELALLNIGCRPSSRAGQDGVAGLRAIDWSFSWTQNRLVQLPLQALQPLVV